MCSSAFVRHLFVVSWVWASLRAATLGVTKGLVLRLLRLGSAKVPGWSLSRELAVEVMRCFDRIICNALESDQRASNRNYAALTDLLCLITGSWDISMNSTFETNKFNGRFQVARASPEEGEEDKLVLLKHTGLLLLPRDEFSKDVVEHYSTPFLSHSFSLPSPFSFYTPWSLALV